MKNMHRIITKKAKTFIAILSAFFAVAYILSAGGCDFGKAEIVKETNEPHYLRGQKELSRGNVSEAMSAFLKVTEKRKDAPESNFELGRIYLDNMNDPIQAIYHFRKYLELKPNSQVSPMVRQMIDTAQKRFAASFPESPFEDNVRRLELEDLLQKVQKENLELKQRLNSAVQTIDALKATQRVSVAPSSSRVQSHSDSSTAVQASSTPSSAPVPDVRRDAPSTYTVQPGDTLSSISRKVYGTPNKWRDIFNANRDRMPTPEALKPGQVLKINR